MNRVIQVAGAIGMLFAAGGQGPARPEVPESLQAPAGEEVILAAHAAGTQIYVCQAGAEQKFAWVFKAPEADLTDATGNKIAHHFAGPTWKHRDGSEVKGKVIAKQDAPKPEAIPWLLLRATSHSGEGVFSRVTSMQRIHTEGGLPPKDTGCDRSASGKEVGMVYAADYYFYAPAH
jgi:predicted FMN-binding regulatory protein PaiB